MKQTLLWLAIGLMMMATVSCDSKQDILDQMEKEVTAMQQNVDTYAYDDWESAHERLYDQISTNNPTKEHSARKNSQKVLQF